MDTTFSTGEMGTTQPANNVPSNITRKAAALFEVLGILVGGSLVADLLMSWTGVRTPAELMQQALGAKQPHFLALSVGWVQAMCVQYAFLLLPAFAVGRWRRRSGLEHYGITTAGQPVWRLLVLALGAFALLALPLKLVWVLRQHVPLGPDPAAWAVLTKGDSISFLVFLVISSFVLTPVLEELFFRSYCQTRLEEDFGGLGALVIVTLMMMSGYAQHCRWSVLSIGALILLVPVVLGAGYLFWRTRSIVPAVTLHVLATLPVLGINDLLVSAIVAGILLLSRGRWLRPIRSFCAEWKAHGWRSAVFPAAVVAVLVTLGFERWPAALVALTIPAFVIGLVLDLRERRLAEAAPQIAA